MNNPFKPTVMIKNRFYLGIWVFKRNYQFLNYFYVVYSKDEVRLYFQQHVKLDENSK